MDSKIVKFLRQVARERLLKIHQLEAELLMAKQQVDLMREDVINKDHMILDLNQQIDKLTE